MYKIVLSLMAGMIFLISCHNNSKDSSSQESSAFETVLATDVPTTIELSRETLPIDILHPTDMLAIDTFLVIMQHHESKIIKVFSANSYKFLGDFLMKGGGPNEVVTFGRVSQWFIEAGEPKIVIQSYPNYLAVLDIRKSLVAGEAVFDRKYTFETDNGKRLFMASNSVYEINQKELMMTKDPFRSGIKNNSNCYWELYDYDKDQVYRKIAYENFNELIDLFLKGADRLLKPDHTKMALLYNMLNLISIVDLEKGHIKQIYPGGRSFDIKTELEMDNRSSYFDEGECTDQFIFALSSKGLKVSEKENYEMPFSSQLDVYDWNGHYIYKADLGERIRLISVDNNQRYLYAINTDDTIIRYELSRLE